MDPVANLPCPEPVLQTSAQEGSFRDSQRACILHALRAAGGVLGGPRGAAARLGLKRTTLIGKMRKLGITRPERQGEMSGMDHYRQLIGGDNQPLESDAGESMAG